TRFSRDWSSDVCSSDLNQTSTVRRYLSLFMAALFMFTSMVSLHAQASQAAMTATHEVIAQEQLSVDRDQLKAMLDDEAVQDKLRSEERRVGKEGRECGG